MNCIFLKRPQSLKSQEQEVVVGCGGGNQSCSEWLNNPAWRRTQISPGISSTQHQDDPDKGPRIALLSCLQQLLWQHSFLVIPLPRTTHKQEYLSFSLPTAGTKLNWMIFLTLSYFICFSNRDVPAPNKLVLSNRRQARGDIVSWDPNSKLPCHMI
jgi:hypothetical protein